MKQTIAILLVLAAGFAAQADVQVQPSSVYAASVWKNNPTWTQTTLLTVREHIASLEKARDIEDFCPGYANANPRSREICWLRVVGGIVRWESNFNASSAYYERLAEAYSVGLMSLSPGESEIAPTVEMLKIPELNLQAGITMLAKHVARDGYLSGPEGALGGAAYWAVLRAPYKVGGFSLGMREKIVQYTSQYLKY